MWTSPCALLATPTKCRYVSEITSRCSRGMHGAELPSSGLKKTHCPFQQAQEMVQEILRERGHGGFSERNDFGSHMGGGGGMDVSLLDEASTAFEAYPNLQTLQMLSTQIPVPRHSVGVVIGRSGEMIKKIQNDAGVRIQFKQGRSLDHFGLMHFPHLLM